MQGLTWYLHRLRRMSLAEVAHRMWRATQDALPISRTSLAQASEPRFPIQWPASWIVAQERFATDAYAFEADRLAQGIHDVFHLQGTRLGSPPNWNRDPLTGIVAPLVRAPTIDYRDERIVGNIKYLWEPNRHLHVVSLAQAFALTGDIGYAREVQRQIESWIDQCPYPLGANWASSLELGIRLINWSLCWQLLGGVGSPIFSDAAGQGFRQKWLRSIYLHARHINGHLSRFSSANNHLIGEAAAIVVATHTWPCWSDFQHWGASCRSILIEETLRQNAPDGGNREQAVSYQQFVLDFLILAGLASRAAGSDMPTEYWSRIESMIDFLASMSDVSGNVPMLGDADDGYVVRLSPEASACPYRSLIATGAILFGRPDLASKARTYDDKSKWLFGQINGERKFADLLCRAGQGYTPRREFWESGYRILGRDFELPHEIRLIVDSGPLGYLSIAAHGHADALSFVLSVAGDPILIDPGTYCYHTEPVWREYFRGTAAHNTVRVDGEDQSVQRGNFMWSSHAQTLDVDFSFDDMRQYFTGCHDGYQRLPDPVLHRREISFEHERSEFEIRDTLSASGSHEVVRYWHFSENVEVEASMGVCTAMTGRATVTLKALDAPDDQQVLAGNEDPPGGWVSHGFGRKVPTKTIVWRNRIHGTTVLRTRLTCRVLREGSDSPSA